MYANLCSAENGCVVPIIGFRVDVCRKRPLPPVIAVSLCACIAHALA